MTAEELITSGILELYVCGALPQSEIQEVEDAIAAHPEVKNEVERIEATLIALSKNTVPELSPLVWSNTHASIGKTIPLKPRRNWAALTGWAATVLCIGGILWMLNQQGNLSETIEVTQQENKKIQNELDLIKDLVNNVRGKDYTVITLPGNQAVAPNAFAKVYINKKEQIAYLDTNGLPKAPEGKVYQVWSLLMDPLTPTNVGLINTKSNVAPGFYKFKEIEEAPEAFGITLEPSGGSTTPTLSKLYTLGSVSP